jgi:hypothetical protein
MNFLALDPFAVAGNHGEDAGREVISPASPDLPIPSRHTSDFFTYASESPANQGLEEEEHVGGDSVETETDQGHSPPGFCHADSSSPEGASVIDLRPRPWKKRCVLDSLNRSITIDFVLLSLFDATGLDVIS